MGIDTLIEIIRECKTLGDLYWIEDFYVKDVTGLDKIDLETECLKKFQELTRK